MQLLLFILVAGVVGYLLARSRLSKPIDDTTEKVADTTRKAAEGAESWITRSLRREKKPEDEVVEGEAKPIETAPPAAKQSSRRRTEDEQTENEGGDTSA
jgi:hypothetical protein